MKKIRGFKIGKRLIRLTKRVLFRRSRNPRGYNRLTQPEPVKECKTLSRIMNWGRKLTVGARSICRGRTGSGYAKLGGEPWCNEKDVSVPKGHLAVYVGQKDGDFHRVLVPVIYVNHPLFGELLREAEEEFGFCQEGGITIPCGFSDFEKVQTQIRDSPGCGRKLTWRLK